VELACKLADMAGDSTVIELIERGSGLLPGGRAFNREQALRALQHRDVRLRIHSRVIAVQPDRLELEVQQQAEVTGVRESLAVNGVIWTAGTDCQPPAMTPAPAQDDQGRLLCEPDLRLRGHDHLFVAGDLACPQGRAAGTESDPPLPATAQVAFQQAPLLAANLRRSLAGQPLQPFEWNDLGEMISLGRGDASICGSGLTLAGPAAYQLRRLAYLTRLPRLSHQLRVAAGWLADWTP
jgi:NADH dehydrogenase